MKKVLFALPFLALSISGCARSSLGFAATLSVKEITSITVTYRFGENPETYVVSEEHITDVAKNILNMPIERHASPCKCISSYWFELKTASTTYTLDAYIFSGGSKVIYYEIDEDSYATVVNYAIDRAN